MVDDEEIADDITGLNDLFSDWDQEMIQPTSPDRSSRPGSPGMDELMGQRNSPGLPSSNGGQKPQQDTEEVSSYIEGIVQYFLLLIEFDSFRLELFCNNHCRWATWCRRRRLAECPTGSGPHVRTWRMCVRRI